jgi:hypothetical protein
MARLEEEGERRRRKSFFSESKSDFCLRRKEEGKRKVFKVSFRVRGGSLRRKVSFAIQVKVQRWETNYSPHKIGGSFWLHVRFPSSQPFEGNHIRRAFNYEKIFNSLIFAVFRASST